MSGVFQRFPELRIAYSEGQVGWAPYVLERADKLWEERGRCRASAPTSPSPRRATCKDHIWFCIFDDETGLA